MIPATYEDKDTVVQILCQSFNENQSVNYIVKADSKRLERLEYLMEYSFEHCWLNGEVFLSRDRKGCALVSYPNKKQRFSLKPYLLDAKLLLRTIGLKNLKKTLTREALIKKAYPNDPFLYLWFIGVKPEAQGQGIGSGLLQQIMGHAHAQRFPVYLETSTLKNLPWYENYQFSIYHTIDLGYPLYMLRTTEPPAGFSRIVTPR